MEQKQIVNQLQDAIKELGYAQMYVKDLIVAIEAGDNSKAKEIINGDLEDYTYSASNAFGAGVYGVKVNNLQDEIQNYFDELEYEAEEAATV